MEYVDYGYRNASDNDAANLGYLALVAECNEAAIEWLDSLVPGQPYVAPEQAAIELGYDIDGAAYKAFMRQIEWMRRTTRIYVCPWSNRVLDIVEYDDEA